MKLVFESLNEFKRIKSDQEIRRSLFDWRRGQILVVRSAKSIQGLPVDDGIKIVSLYIFAEKKDSDIPGRNSSGNSFPWNMHVFEIGYIAGNPKYVHIAYGMTNSLVVKREDSLEEPAPEEKDLISKALKEKKFQKYIKRATEIIGIEPFV